MRVKRPLRATQGSNEPCASKAEISERHDSLLDRTAQECAFEAKILPEERKAQAEVEEN